MNHKILGDLSLIKPKIKGKSDKYSWNFYKYLNKLKTKDIKIYYRKYDYFSGALTDFNETDFSTGNTLIISKVIKHDKGLIGSSLSSVLRSGKIDEYYYSNIHNNYFEVTEEFFDLYLDKGRCLFDFNHNGWLAYDDDRFTIYDKYRICNYCGKRQSKKVEIINEEVVNWI